MTIMDDVAVFEELLTRLPFDRLARALTELATVDITLAASIEAIEQFITASMEALDNHPGADPVLQQASAAGDTLVDATELIEKMREYIATARAQMNGSKASAGRFIEVLRM